MNTVNQLGTWKHLFLTQLARILAAVMIIAGNVAPLGTTLAMPPGPQALESITLNDEVTPSDTPAATDTPTDAPAPTDTPTPEATATPPFNGTPTIETDKEEYFSSAIVTISGSNFIGLQSLDLVVTAPNGISYTGDGSGTAGWDTITADLSGNFVYEYSLNYYGEGVYTIQVYDHNDTFHTTSLASTVFSDPSDQLEQCRNGTLASPQGCAASGRWTTGNLGSSNSHYREGDSVPFRASLGGLASGSHILEIQYDFTEGGGEHAYDYLTSFDRTETTANPCAGAGVSPCSGPNLFPIPADPNLPLAAPPVPQVAGNIAIYDGTITNVQYFNHPAGPEGSALKVSVQITFTVNSGQNDVVIAWGGHIASQIDWGLGDSASAISGSPYHMRLLSLDGQGGNKDRSIQASAIISTLPTITTQISSSNITVGQSVTDLATLSGPNGAVTGSVKFFVCGPAGSPPDCTTGGTQVGGAVTISSGSATSAAFTPVATGTYCFRAEYSPDAGANYAPFNHTNTTTECFTAVSASPTIITTPSPASGAVGTTLNDTANLAGGYSPTGTITFNLYDPSNATCSGAPAFTEAVAVSGNGNYSTTGGFVSNVAGTWRWTASYSGDSNNDAASSGCQDEQVTVGQASPALTTTPNPASGPEGTTLNDTANLAGGSSPTGAITFNLYDPSDATCSGTPAFTQTVAVSGNSNYSTTGGFVANTVGTWRWTASYSGDSNNNPASSDCQDELVILTDITPTITVTKDASPLSLPEPGGSFSFTVTVINNSTVESVTLDSLVDDVYGDLNGQGTCATGGSIASGGTYSCTFSGTFTGDAGDSQTDTVTASASDNEGNDATGSDTATVSITDVTPTITVTKDASPLSLPEPGGSFSFTLTITNNSVETVTITALTDTNALSQECLDLIGTTLAPGASASCAYTVTHTDSGVYPNTAEVTIQDDEGNSASDDDSETVEVTDTLPAVTLDKSASPASLPEPGGAFTFTLTITNNSVEDVTITALTDTNALSAECLALIGTTLTPGQVVSCTYTVNHTDAGSYDNTANVTVEDDEQNPASDSDGETVEVTDVAPSVTLDKSASPASLPEPGGLFTFTLTITNNSVEDVTITALTDTNAISAECLALIGTTLTPGQVVSCTYTVNHTDAGSYNNTANVTVEDDEQNPASDSDGETVEVTDVAPSVTLVKSASPASLPEPGGAFTFTLTITNNSVEDVTITALTDTNALSQECLDLIGTTLAPGASASCAYTVTHTDSGVYPNTAEVTIQDDEGNSASDDDSETVEVTDTLPAVTLDKSASPASLPEPGGLFTFTLTITNNSVEDVTITALTDTNALSQECLDLISDTLAPGASVSCTYTVTHTDAGSYSNTANVTVEDDEGNGASDDDSETVEVTDVAPSVTLDKSASPASLPEPGGSFSFTLTITNNSVEDVTLTALTDTNALSAECLALIGTTLAPGVSVSCTYTVTHTDAGSYGNTANVTVEDDEGNSASDDDSETVTVTDVGPSVTLVKSASPASLPEPGGAFTFTLTITNNSVEDVTLTALTDTNALSQECLDLIGDTLAPGASVSCTYTVNHADAGSYSNTANVTVEDDEGNGASDDDSETVEVTDTLPAVTLDKSASPASLPEPGGSFSFTLTITNNSVETVTITALTDTNALSAECLALIGTTLAPGASVSCTYTVTHTDSGVYPNTAEVTVQDDEGNSASSDDSESVEVTDTLPSVTLDKSASPASLPEPGGLFTFTLTITNNSVEDVTLTALTDTNALSAECLALIGTTLTPGQVVSCTYTVTHTDAGSYGNTANVTVEDDEGNSASDDDSETVTVTDVGPSVTLVKSASPASLPEPGGLFTFTLTITNNSVEDVTLTALTDTNAISAECLALIGTTLTPGQVVSCTYTVTHTDAGSYDNTASVTVEDDEQNPASDSDGETVEVTDVAPTVTLDKAASLASLPEPGGAFTFTLTITNNSVEDVTITALTDTNALSQECLDLISDTLAPGASVSCTYTVTHTDAGSYNNTANVTVEDDEQNPASDSDGETVEVTDVAPSVTLDKSASPASLPEPGGLFTFTLTITNNSVETVTITALTDTNALSAECLALIGTTLTPGQVVSCTYTVNHTDAGSYNNTASVTVEDDEGNSASDDDSKTVTVTDVGPSVTLVKSASPASLPEPGGLFTFTLTITNNSVEDVTLTALADTNALSAECLALIGTTLAPGASVSCTYTVTHADAGSYDNTASVTVEDDEQNPASDSDDETVTVTDVAPSVTLDKSASPASLPEPGGAFTFTLTITNNSVEDVTITALTDTNALSAECLALIGTTLTPGASVSCTYTVTHTDAGSYSNTASVTVEDDEQNPASDSDDETVTITDTLPSVTLDKSVTPSELPMPGGLFTFTLTITNNSVEDVTITALIDTNALSAECLALIGTTLAPGASVSCTYTVTHTAPGVYNNTASVTVADNEGNSASASDSESVMVTNPVIALDKIGPVYAFSGEAITFTYQVSNAGNVPLGNVAVTDDKCGNAAYVSGDMNNDGKLDLDEVWTFTCAYTPVFTSLNTLTNVGTATGEYQGQQTTDTDDFTLYPFTLRKRIFLYWNSPANTVPYSQPDNTPFTVNMYQGSTFAATFTISQNSPKRIWLSAGTYNFQEVNLPPGYLAGHNFITYATGQGYPDWTFPNVITFDLAIDKTGPAGAFKGDTVTYNYTVTNAGPASVAPVVSDNKCSPLVYLGGDTDSDGLVDPGEAWKYKCNYTVTQEPGIYVTNKATVDDVFEPAPGWHLGGDRNLSNNTDSWTFRVQWKGCTVNYWKANTSLWPSPYTTTTLVTGVFTVPSSYFTGGKLDLNTDGQADNLLKALNYSTSGSTTVNGAARNLLRAAVAALFNEVKYGNLYPPYATKTALISAVNSALATRNANTMMSLANTLNKWNNGVCP